jgi:hypothetical protein
MKEYVRRAAWWATITRASGFPFFDIAAGVDPGVRADPSRVGRVDEQLRAQSQGVLVRRTCAYALHFAALLDAGVPLPQAPKLPFEPILTVFGRGGGFRVDGGGLIDLGLLRLPVGSVEDNLRTEPCVRIGVADLDALDRRRR